MSSDGSKINEMNPLDSLSSRSSLNQDNLNPVSLENKDSAIRKYSTARSSGQYSNVSRINLNQSSNHLSRLPSSYSVRDIYGDLDENDIELRRTATKSTILNTLTDRAKRTTTNQDQENQVKSEGPGEEEEEGDSDENNPEYFVQAKNNGEEFNSIDPELVTWDGHDDPAYPRNWSFKQRCFQTLIVSIYTLISPMSSSLPSPAIDEIAESLGFESSTFLKAFSISVMVLAWALGPLVIAPLSESDLVGRRPVLNISIWIVGLFNLVGGFAKTPAQFCIFRFLGGLGGCASLNVGAGTLADIWKDDERGAAMAAYSLSPQLGPVIAPVISSFIVTGMNWHWCFYILAIFTFVVAFFGLIFFKETYAPKLLRDKAKKLRKETGNQHLHTIYEISNGETPLGVFYLSITRPLQFIVGHPMVTGLGSYMAFVYGFMYLMICTFPEVFKGKYHFSTNISGLMYLSMGVGYVIGSFFWAWAINRECKRQIAKNNGQSKPEFTLRCLVIAGGLTPIGLIIYGWGAHFTLPWIVPCVGAGIFAFCMVCVFNTIQTYLIQMNNLLSASSVAAAAVFRSCIGFAMPLVATPLYNRLNYGWGTTLCAFIMLVLGVPFPLFCIKYGESLRLWANRRFDRKKALRDEKNLRRLQQQNEKHDKQFD